MIKQEERLEKKQSLSTKFLSLFVFLAVIPLFLVGIFSLSQSIEKERETISQGEVNKAEFIAQQIRRDRVFLEETSLQLSRHPSLSSFDLKESVGPEIKGLPADLEAETRIILQNVISVYSQIDAVYLLTIDGDVYLAEPYAAQESLNLSNLAFQGWFICARFENKVCQGRLFLENQTFIPYYVMSAPIVQSGELKGILALKVNLDSIYSTIQSAADSEQGKIFVVDDLGVVIASSDQDDVISQISINGQLPFREISKDKSGFILTKVDGEKVFLAFVPIEGEEGVEGGVIVQQPTSSFFAGIHHARNIYLLIFVVAGVAVILIALFATRTVAKPIEDLTHVATQISLGDLDQEVNITSQDEIGVLAFNFNKMVYRLKEFYNKLENAVAERTDALNQKVKDLEAAKKTTQNVLKDLEKSKDKIEENKQWFEAILSSIGEGVYVLDNKEKIILFNDAASRLLGWDKKEMIGQDELKILQPEDEKGHKITKASNKISQAWLGGKTQTFKNLFFKKKDKKVLPVALAVAPIKNRQGEVIAGVIAFRDTTIEREIDRMKSEFVSVASHQLRTPLSSIKWFLEMILGGRAGKINDKQNEFIKEAYMSNQRMIDLVNSLLNVSRIETGRLAIAPEPTDLIELTKSVITENTPDIKIKKQQLQFIPPKEKLSKISIDPRIVRQVLQNLINNACKYTPERGKIEVEISPRKDDILFRVEDTGYGIPRDQQDKMFQKFFRADNVILQATEGSGLGLYVAKSAVELSGGKIWFESEENKGSAFYFTLPKKGSPRVKGEKSISVI